MNRFKNGDKYFNAETLRVIDFVEFDDGEVFAFDMSAFKTAQDLSEESGNSLKIFNKKDIDQQALSLILSAPLLYKVLLACHSMQDAILNTAEAMQSQLKANLNMQLGGLEQITTLANHCQSMIIAAVNVPAVGRDETVTLLDKLAGKNVDKG